MGSLRSTLRAVALALVLGDSAALAIEDEDLLLALRLGTEPLADALPAILRDGDVLLPLGELCALLELPLEVDADRGTAAGAFGVAATSYSLDRQAGMLVAGSRATPLPAASVVARDGELYIAAPLLAVWLPLDIAIDLRAAEIRVREREPLPRTLARQREERRRALSAKSGEPSQLDLAPVEPRRRLASIPAADLSLVASGDGHDTEARYAGYFSGDLLRLDATLSIVGQLDGDSEVRGTLGRRDSAGRLLGPLRAREVVAGDIYFPGIELVAGATSGRGFLISNRPFDRPTRFDEQVFRGPLPPGWQVELYRAGELIGFSTGSADGTYEIPGVAIDFGRNEFRLVFLGPRGERREELVRFEVADRQVPRSGVQYRVAAIESDSGVPARSGIEVDWGWTDRLTITGGVASVGEGSDRRDYGIAALSAWFPGLVARLDTATDSDGESSARIALSTRLRGWSATLDHAELGDVASPAYAPGAGPPIRRSRVRLQGTPRPAGLAMPVTLEALHDQLVDGGRIVDLSARLSTFRGRTYLGNVLRWRTLRRDGLDFESGGGTLLFSRFGQRASLRGELDYEWQPEAELLGLRLAGEWRLPADHLLLATAVRGLRGSTSSYGLELRRTDGPVGWGVGVERRTGDDWRGTLSVNLGVTPRPGANSWRTDARHVTSHGSIDARVFLDLDADGAFGPGDEALPGVGILVDGLPTRSRTGADGVLFLGRLPAFRPIRVEVEERTLEDPLWVPALRGAEIVLRPGPPAPVEIAILATNDLVGHLTVRRDGATREIAGLRVQLLDRDGGLVAESRTSFDGSFEFSRVLPGEYVLRLEPGQAARLGLARPELRELSLGEGGQVIEGLDHILEPVAPEAGDPDPDPPAPLAPPLSR